MDTNFNCNRDVLVVLSLLLAMPVITFLVLRRSRMPVRITLAVLVLVSGVVAVPFFARARVTVSTHACLTHLQVIQETKRRWAEANRKSPADVPTLADLFNDRNGPEFRTAPECPMGGIYAPRAVGEKAECSIGRPGHTLDPQ